jgi:hypothetical protein
MARTGDVVGSTILIVTRMITNVEATSRWTPRATAARCATIHVASMARTGDVAGRREVRARVAPRSRVATLPDAPPDAGSRADAPFY